MDKRMMAEGGESKRAELFQKMSSLKMTEGMNAMSLDGGQQNYTEEEKKVAMYGEKGQGEYLTDAKRGRR